MFYNMLRENVTNFDFFTEEIHAGNIIGIHGNYCTKRPFDCFEMSRINVANIFKKRHDVIFTVRDPRSVLTSYHSGLPDKFMYHMDFCHRLDGSQFKGRGIRGTMQCYRDIKDKIVVKYEDIVHDPDAMQTYLAEKLELEFEGSIKNFGENEIPKKLEGPLNGVRPLDETRLDSWKEHQEYIDSIMTPELEDIIEELGYENA